MLLVRMRDDEALGSCFVAGGNIGGTPQGQLDKVTPPDGRADGREGIGDAERAVRDACRARRDGNGPGRTAQLTPPGVGSAVRR